MQHTQEQQQHEDIKEQKGERGPHMDQIQRSTTGDR